MTVDKAKKDFNNNNLKFSNLINNQKNNNIFMNKDKTKFNSILKSNNNNPMTLNNIKKTSLNDNSNNYINTYNKNNNNSINMPINEINISNKLKNYPSFEENEFQDYKKIGEGSFGTIWSAKKKRQINYMQ